MMNQLKTCYSALIFSLVMASGLAAAAEHGGAPAQAKEHGGEAAKSKEHGGKPASSADGGR